MKNKDDKDTEIIRQLKGKSTFLTDSLAVAKVVAENTDDQGYVGCSEAVQCQEETHPKRLELPIFSGDNPCEWLHRAEQYFHFTGIGDKDNLESSMSLDGTVSDLQWSLVEFESLFEDPAGKNETEHIVKEMMAKGTVESSTISITSLVFHVSCIKCVVKNSTLVQQPPPFLSKDLKMQEKPECVVNYWFLLDGSQEMLIKWKYFPSFEKTLESYVVVSVQFSSFHHEDKVELVGAVIVRSAVC
ncbi:hypothetical protein V6N12_012933 [Hibiscus sabdariffa]|uniref:Uncharacterized protein n=1 Tax=Hibiscus sabdariffa TaxID=183260 RepID=A0ABR2EHG6_9ROSI